MSTKQKIYDLFLEALKHHVTVRGGRLADAEGRKIVCMLQGKEQDLNLMYQKELKAVEPPTKISIDQTLTWTGDEAGQLQLKAVIDGVLLLLAKSAGESCSGPDDGREGAQPNLGIAAPEPALATTTVEVGVVGTAPSLSEESVSSYN